MEQQKISAHHEADIVELQTRQRQTLDRLLAMTQRQHLELWKTLDAPKVQDLNGEFFGVVTTLGLTPAIYSLTYDVMFNPTGISGWWLGKAFRATGETTGEGYNRWQRPGGRQERSLRFGTSDGISEIDGRPALMMRYADFENRSGAVDLRDEIRVYQDEIYLGAAHYRYSNGKRSDPGVFMLVGPGSPWRGVDDESAEV